MSEEVVPQQAGHAQSKGLLQQMEELMAALNADPSALYADFSTGVSSTSAKETEAGRASPGRVETLAPLPDRAAGAGLFSIYSSAA